MANDSWNILQFQVAMLMGLQRSALQPTGCCGLDSDKIGHFFDRPCPSRDIVQEGKCEIGRVFVGNDD